MLTHFSLNNNKIESLQLDFGGLTNLEEFEIASNNPFELPETLVKSGSLKKINFSNNRIVSLPENIGSCISLQKLELSNNRIIALPESVSNMTNIFFT